VFTLGAGDDGLDVGDGEDEVALEDQVTENSLGSLVDDDDGEEGVAGVAIASSVSGFHLAFMLPFLSLNSNLSLALPFFTTDFIFASSSNLLSDPRGKV
jgi:hypothetical protein